jgi:hypothetical protein
MHVDIDKVLILISLCIFVMVFLGIAYCLLCSINEYLKS